MSSPNEAQVYPTGVSDKITSPSKNLKSPKSGLVNPTEENTDSRAWEERSRGSNSLGHNVKLQVSSTGGFSSEEDSDYEEDDLNTTRGMTRSLGRKEMNSLMSAHRVGSSKVIPVSERSTFYKELVTSSQNSWKSDKHSPRHSAVKESDESGTSRIELNPFFQLDKLAKLQPGMSEEQRKSSPSHMSSLSKPTSNQSGSNSPVHRANSSVITGMSVQMRIKMWAEKEKEPEKLTKLTHRRSFQSASLLAVESNADDEKFKDNRNTTHSDDEVLMQKINSTTECTIHSDDEVLMQKINSTTECTTHSDNGILKQTSNTATENHPKPRRENPYAEISDQVEQYRVREASSSSDERSPASSPAKPPQGAKNLDESRSPKTSKKKDKSNKNRDPKKSKWKLRSPLPKRKHKIKRSPSNENLNGKSKSEKNDHHHNKNENIERKSVNGSLDQDDVFSPSTPSSATEKVLQTKVDSEENSKENLNLFACDQFPSQSEALPSVFDKVCAPPVAVENGSISHDILNIIGSFGTIKENHTPSSNTSINISIDGDSDSGKFILSPFILVSCAL